MIFEFFKGIQPQGSNPVYRGQPFDKGHLFPGMTSSSTQDSHLSTFTFTNAVPQRIAFNRGQWSQFERRIRQYALRCTGAPQNGVLYLITGASFVAIQGNPPQANQVPINQLPPMDIPNSMWTAGMCVPQNGNAQSFAVIGNNVQNVAGILTQQITVAQLEAILQIDLQVNGLKRSQVKEKVNLFPAIAKSVNINLSPDPNPKEVPEEEY